MNEHVKSMCIINLESKLARLQFFVKNGQDMSADMLYHELNGMCEGLFWANVLDVDSYVEYSSKIMRAWITH